MSNAQYAQLYMLNPTKKVCHFMCEPLCGLFLYKWFDLVCLKMLSNPFLRFLCFYMLSNAFICFHMLSDTLISFKMLLYPFIRFHMVSNAFICFHTLLVRFNTLSNAFIRFHLLLHAFTCLLTLC